MALCEPDLAKVKKICKCWMWLDILSCTRRPPPYAKRHRLLIICFVVAVLLDHVNFWCYLVATAGCISTASHI
eukprot:4361874-Amphidinium_carterae.1